jgi:hypothetical protein
MSSLHELNLIYKARRHYQLTRRRNPDLPALVPGGGELAPHARGFLAVLPTVGGDPAVYQIALTFGIKVREATPQEINKLGLTTVEMRSTPSLEKELQQAIDKMLVASAAIEQRAREAVKPSAPSGNGVDHHPHKGNGSGEPINHLAAE